MYLRDVEAQVHRGRQKPVALGKASAVATVQERRKHRRRCYEFNVTSSQLRRYGHGMGRRNPSIILVLPDSDIQAQRRQIAPQLARLMASMSKSEASISWSFTCKWRSHHNFRRHVEWCAAAYVEGERSWCRFLFDFLQTRPNRRTPVTSGKSDDPRLHPLGWSSGCCEVRQGVKGHAYE